MAQLKNTNVDTTGFLQLPSGTTAQRPASPQDGMTRYNTDLGLVEVFQTAKGWTTFSNFNTPSAAGSTSALAVDTPKDICRSRTTGFNGVYWYKNTLSAGVTYQAYTLMDSTYDGGGWTLAFNYDARSGNSMPGGIPHWDNNTFWRDTSVLNTTNASPWSTNVKTVAFDSIPFDEILFLVHRRNGYSPVSTQVRGWSVYRNANRVNRGSIANIISQGYNLILSSGGRKTGANYAGNLSHNSRRSQTRGGDAFIDGTVNSVNNGADNLVFNSQGYWGSDVRNNTRIATTAGLGNTSYGHTTSGIGIRHGHAGWGYYAGWTPIQAYCEPSAMYTTSTTMSNNYITSPESGNQIHLNCNNIGWADGYLDLGISVFVR